MAAPTRKFFFLFSGRLPSSLQAGQCATRRVPACLCSQQATSPAPDTTEDPLKPAGPDFIESKEDFKWVEKLLPRHRIPPLPQHTHYPTPCGWTPPRDPPPDLTYYVRRSRYHQIPVYARFTHQGSRKMTVIQHIEGDIWALEKELQEFLPPIIGRLPGLTVNEVTRKIFIKGLVLEEVKKWLLEKGF